MLVTVLLLLLLLLLLLSTKIIAVAWNQKTARPPNNVRQCHSSDKHQWMWK